MVNEEGREQARRGISVSGLNLLVVTPDRIDEIMTRAQSLVEAQHRHELELIRAGLTPEQLASAEDENTSCNTKNCAC